MGDDPLEHELGVRVISQPGDKVPGQGRIADSRRALISFKVPEPKPGPRRGAGGKWNLPFAISERRRVYGQGNDGAARGCGARQQMFDQIAIRRRIELKPDRRAIGLRDFFHIIVGHGGCKHGMAICRGGPCGCELSLRTQSLLGADGREKNR